MFLKQRTFNKRGNKSCILFWKYSNLLRWTAMWASDCRSQPLNQYSLLFIVICVCSLFFIYSIFFVGVFYVTYFDNSNIVYCIYNLKKLYLTLINTGCHCLEFLSVIPSLFSSSWWLNLCQSGLVLSLLRNMFTLTRYWRYVFRLGNLLNIVEKVTGIDNSCYDIPRTPKVWNVLARNWLQFIQVRNLKWKYI